MLLNVQHVSIKFLVDVIDDRLMQRLVVSFERQQIIRFAIDDRLGDRFLGPHGVDRDEAPLMSTSFRTSGIAVISLDFSAQATCPSDSPNSLAQTLTECKAPRPLPRSWLRRAVLPSTAKIGWVTPAASAAVVRNDCSQLAKQA